MLKRKLFYFPGMFVAGTDYYETKTDLIQRMSRLGIDFTIAKRQNGIPISIRALFWKIFLNDHLAKDEEFYILGYSDGGVSTRLMLNEFPSIAERCKVHISSASPHWGTPKAAKYAKLLEDCIFLSPSQKKIAQELTPDSMIEFNKQNPNIDSIHYFSIPTYIDDWRKARLLTLPSYFSMNQSHGPNDGTVPFSSQLWGARLESIKGDHQACGSPHFKYGGHSPWFKVFEIAVDALIQYEREECK